MMTSTPVNPAQRPPLPGGDSDRARASLGHSSLAISKAYTQDPARPQARRARFWIQAAAVGFCLVYGMAFALFTPGLLIAFPLPIVALAMVVLWAAPDGRLAPTGGFEFAFYGFTAALIVWPPYLALKLGHLPNLNVSRLWQVAMLVLFGICVGTSAPFRRTLADALKTTPLIWRLMAILVLLEAVSPIFAESKPASIIQVVVAQMNWTAAFFIGAYIFMKSGRVERWAKLLWVCSLFAGAIACVEAHKQQVLWAGHVPFFLQVNDESTLKKLAGNMRAGTGVYRAQSTFGGPIQFAEFMCLSFPFIANFVSQKYKMTTRWLAGLSLAFLTYATLLSHSRTGGMGILLCGLLYPLYLAVIERRREPGKWRGSLRALAYPAAGGVALMLALASGRIRHKLVGGSETVGSTQARFAQWELGLPKVLHAPWGHGLGTSGIVLGFVDPSGNLTIDTYFLSILLELGVVGFIVYFGMFLYGSYRAARCAIEDSGDDPEVAYLAPAAIALLAFVVSKVNFSEQDNHPLFFMTLGMAVALICRQHKSRDEAATKSTVDTRPNFVRRTTNRHHPNPVADKPTPKRPLPRPPVHFP